ncbi:UNVERIFIED_CONTAM: L-asparaginase II [Brevibacillus sp. OAP136]
MIKSGTDKLVEITRGNLVESSHSGALAVVSSSGKLLHAIGDVNQLMYARSALKPFQVISFLESGAYDHFRFLPKHLALACGSHNGEHQHTETTEDMLALIGLSDVHLHCHGHSPFHQESYESLIREGTPFKRVHNNCSGKHAAMLAQCIFHEYAVEGYQEESHSLQQEVLRNLSEVTGVPASQIEVGIDGCGLPTHAIPLRQVAYAYSQLADPMGMTASKRKALMQIGDAMTANPKMVGGTGAFCTDLMTTMKGSVVGKVGAEGVYCMALRDRGIGIAIKIFDGSERGLYPVAMEVLDQLGVLSEEQKLALKAYHTPEVRNRQNEVVGSVRPTFTLATTDTTK